jgi:TonB family protein
MRTIVLSICFGLVLVGSAVAQVARDTPPPAIETARRERELRAIVDSGKATKDTYLELATLLNRQHRSAEVIDALRGAAALDPNSAEAQHRLATFCWEIASKGTDLDAAARMRYILDGIAAEDRALAINPDYLEAMTYKNILLRMEANVVDDPAEKARLVADADALRNHVIAAQKERQAAAGGAPPPLQPGAPEPPPPPFTGFSEPFEDTAARLTPVRVGGNIPQPTKTHDVKPVYPAEAQSARVQGVVIVEAIIDPSGSIANARVLRSIPLLDQAALGAVSQWRFTPTELNGQRVGVLMTVTVNFTIQP